MPQAQLIFERQWFHALLLAALLVGLAVVSGADGVRGGQLWGVTTPVWFWLAVALAVVHQAYVWLCWRAQLHASWLTRTFGTYGFALYAVGFSVLGILRVAAVFILAASNRDTLEANPLVLKLLAIIAFIPATYLFYSVKRYFGFKRAFGIDHFDTSYRSLPFVRKGIFRFTRNGMYVYGFLLLWVPAFWFASLAALAVALFNHLYIWVHYFATELPDMKRIYGEARATARNGSA
ncbi:MAG TPA: methyltransferase [Burkholderiales bacterium]|nr:methyltransferase [Burkholderiales bacterium]